VTASEGCLEAQACPVAEQRALRPMLAIDQSFDRLLEPGNTRFNGFAPVVSKKEPEAVTLDREKGEEEPKSKRLLRLFRLRQPRCTTTASHRRFWNYRDEATVTYKEQIKRRRE
jgi:hypothetical protein